MSTTPSAAPDLAVQVRPGSFLTLHYRLGGPAGDIINTFGGKPATLSLGTGELSAAVEQCLLGLSEGARATFELPAGAAFGERNPELIQRIADARSLNPETIMPAYYSTEGLQRVAGAYAGQTVLSGQGLEDIVAYLLANTRSAAAALERP
mgnify:CR=1 FL=1